MAIESRPLPTYKGKARHSGRAREGNVNLGFEPGVERDLGIEQLRDGTAGFRVIGRGIELLLCGAGNLGGHREMHRGNGKTAIGLLKRDRRFGGDAVSGQASGSKLAGECHGKASGMSSTE